MFVKEMEGKGRKGGEKFGKAVFVQAGGRLD
jgi:hypothetical protein